MLRPHDAGDLPVVSVIIPAYNVEAFIGEAIDSVLAQTYSQYEVIVVDDGSSDGTARVVAQYGDRVRYFHQEWAGPGGARNHAIAEAKGELIAFLDADDVWYPEKLEKQVALFRSDPSLGLITTGEEYFDGKNITVLSPSKRERLFRGGNLPEAIVRNSWVATPTVMVPRKVLARIGTFLEDLPVGEDENLWVRITAQYPAALLDEILVRCRLRAGSLTHDPEFRSKGILAHLSRLEAAYPDIEPRIRKALSHRRSVVYRGLGSFYFRKGRYPEARRALLLSLRERCTNLQAWQYLFYCLVPAPILRRLRATLEQT